MAVAYQLKDDLEDTVADGERFCRTCGGVGVDLRSLKPTYLLSLANELADGQRLPGSAAEAGLYRRGVLPH